MVRYGKNFSPKRKRLQIKALLLNLIILGPSIMPVLGEWVSILDQATVLPVVNLHPNSSDKENLITKTFKATIYTISAPGVYNDYSDWYTIDLGMP